MSKLLKDLEEIEKDCSTAKKYRMAEELNIIINLVMMQPLLEPILSYLIDKMVPDSVNGWKEINFRLRNMNTYLKI